MHKTARAIIIENDKLLVFFRRKIQDGKEITYYAIPGGHVEENETSEETVVRELKEEMNLDIEILGYLGSLIVDNKEEIYYHAKIVGGKLCFGGEEFLRNCEDNYYEIVWLSLDEIDVDKVRPIEFVRKVVKLNNEN